MNNEIKMRATYERMWWESDEPDTEPTIEGGYTDPDNPWGGFRYAIPDGLIGEAFSEWREANAKTKIFYADEVCEAAQFVVDFPGGVWDFREGEYATDYRTGVEMSVTLHVDDEWQEYVFGIAEILQKLEDRRLRELRGDFTF